MKKNIIILISIVFLMGGTGLLDDEMAFGSNIFQQFLNSPEAPSDEYEGSEFSDESPGEATEVDACGDLVEKKQKESKSPNSKYRKIVAISNFQVKAEINPNTDQENNQKIDQETISEILTSQLSHALVESDKFVVLKQQYSQKAQFLIEGMVTEFHANSGNSDGDFKLGGISFGGGVQEAHVGAILKIVDPRTGDILGSERIVQKIQSQRVNFGIETKPKEEEKEKVFKFERSTADSLGLATACLIKKAVQKVTDTLSPRPFEGKIIKVKDDGETVYTNAGERNGFAEGAHLIVFEPGEELIDPDTGESLGTELTEIGSVEVKFVHEKYSQATFSKRKNLDEGFVLDKDKDPKYVLKEPL